MGSLVTVTNNEIKNIIKLIRYLGNGRIVLKQTTEKIIDQEGGFLNFLGPTIKHVLTPISENVLLLLGVTAVVSASDAAIQNKIYGSGMTTMII